MDSPQNDTDYLEHWSLLRDTLDLILTNRPGTYDPVSYEQTYSAVYKCVCKSYSERLYKDIMTHVRQILDRWTRDIMLVGDLELPARFNEIHTQYFHAINSLLPIFTYLNRFYVESKLSTNLSVEFERLFVNSLCDDTVDRLVGVLNRFQNIPLSLSQSVIKATLSSLFALGYASKNPFLFSKFLDVIPPALNEADFKVEFELYRRQQASISSSSPFLREEELQRSSSQDGKGNHRKRRFDEVEAGGEKIAKLCHGVH